MSEFKEFLAEGMTIQNGELIMNWNSKDGQNTSFGKNGKSVPFSSKQKKFNGSEILSVYQLDKTIGTAVLKSIKKHSLTTVGTNEYQEFITRTAIYISSSTSGMLNNVDVILSPVTSSFFNNDILDEISNRKPHIKILRESFIKSDVSNIKIDYSNFDGVTDKTKTAMNKIIANAKKTGFIEIKKVPKMFLNYISGVLELDTNIKLKNIKNKNVLIFDDLFASGFTLKEMILSINNYSVKTVNALTVFKTK